MERLGRLSVVVAVLMVAMLSITSVSEVKADANTVFYLNSKNALVFDEPWDYVKAGYFPELNTSELTVECWVNPREDIKPWTDLVGRDYTYPYGIGLVSDGINFYVWFKVFPVDTGGKQLVSTISVPLNQWTHVAGTYSATTGEMKVYVDGTLGGVYNISGDSDIVTLDLAQINFSLSIGTSLWYTDLGGQPNAFFGMMDEVRVSNVARDPSEFLTRDGEYVQGYDDGQADLLDILPPGIRKNVEAQRGFAK